MAPLDEPLLRRFRTDGGALCARLGPLALADVQAGIASQAELASPAKFVISRDGDAEIHAEIPLVAERVTCEKLADAALDAAILCLTGLTRPKSPKAASEPPDHDAGAAAFGEDEIESALSQLPWRSRQLDTGSYQIDAAPAPAHAMRVMLTGQGAGLRASTITAVPVGSPAVRRALVYFALEANARLPLARVRVADSVHRGAEEGAAGLETIDQGVSIHGV